MPDDPHPRPGRRAASPPWERRPRSGGSPSDPTPPAEDQAVDHPDQVAENAAGDDEQVSVAELLRRLGHRGQPRRRAAGGPGNGPAQARPETRTTGDTRTRGESPPDTAGPTRSTAPRSPATPSGATRLQTKRARRERRTRLAGKSLAATAAALVFLATGAAWAGTTYLDSQFHQIGALDEGSSSVVDPAAQYGDENYLLVGSDTRAGADGQVGAGTTEQAGGARSDTVMLAHVPADRGRVVIVSFPRDLQVDRPDCAHWDNDAADYTAQVEPGEPDSKLNAAYALGGPRCLVKVIQQVSGLDINHFVGIDFSGFQKMVDEVGGVDVCAEQPLVDDELGTVLATPGTQHINGTTALNYVRARKVEAEGNGDYGRIQRQQRFLSSLLRTALSNKVLLDPGRLSGFVREFTAATFGDNAGFESLLTLGESLQGLDAGRVTFLTTPTNGTSYDGNEMQNKPEIAAIFRAIIDDSPLPGEKGSDTAPTATTPAPAPVSTLLALDPTTIRFGVLNATGSGGLATQTAAQLAAFGFGAPQVADNFGSTTANSFVQYSAGQQAAAQTLASTIPGATTEQVDGLGDQMNLVVGTSFSGQAVAPTGVGQPLPGSAPVTSAAPLPSDLKVVNAEDAACR